MKERNVSRIVNQISAAFWAIVGFLFSLIFMQFLTKKEFSTPYALIVATPFKI